MTFVSSSSCRRDARDRPGSSVASPDRIHEARGVACSIEMGAWRVIRRSGAAALLTTISSVTAMGCSKQEAEESHVILLGFMVLREDVSPEDHVIWSVLNPDKDPSFDIEKDSDLRGEVGDLGQEG